MDTVCRLRAMASLCRQTAAHRPDRSWKLLAEAEYWDRLANDALRDQSCTSAFRSKQSEMMRTLRNRPTVWRHERFWRQSPLEGHGYSLQSVLFWGEADLNFPRGVRARQRLQ